MNKESSNIRIIDIAEMAGVSVGTVDRVIHNRGRVSEENEKKGKLPAQSDGTFSCFQETISFYCYHSLF
mgnify:CR=1 FL=1